MQKSFFGYRRDNGRVGIRNHVLILPLDDLSQPACDAVANNIGGTVAIQHPYGRLQFGADLDLHFRTLIGAGSNPTEEQYAAAEESAQAMLDQWKAEGGTEDAFALLAMENTADSGSQATGGLYTGVSSANAWDQNFLDWALDPARQSGDTGLVKNESSSTKGWHIMYFVGWNDPSWMYSVKTTLKSEDMTEWMDSLTAEAEVVQGSGISHIS